MMSSLLDAAMRRASNGGFDAPVAVLAGVAAATLVSLAPLPLLEELVLASGLPDFLSAAEPPLGLKARVGFAVVAAVIAFVSAYALMWVLGRSSNSPTVREDDEDFASEPAPAPRMRRRDLHPDAPVRAPLSALRDLGDPFDDAAEPTPPIEPAAADVAPPALPELELKADPEPAVGHELLPESHWAEELSPTVVQPRPQPPRQPQGEATIAELMARLERALERKDAPDHAPAPVPEADTAAETDEPMDVRLRSALENLKRFAPGHG